MWDQMVLCFCACATWLDVAMVVTLLVLLLLGFPAAFTLAGTALAYALIGLSIGAFDPAFIAEPFPLRIFGIAKNGVLLAVPLFVMMGVVLERAGIAEELLDTMARLFGSLRGGLGISVMVVGALLAASTGIVGATVVTMGLLSLPTMMRRGYDPGLASGTIAAAGTLGQIVPPSIVLILLGDVISNAYQESQLRQGVFSPETVTVADLFAGALLPGFALICLYLAYLIGVAILKPGASPAVPAADRFAFRDGVKAAAKALPAPLFLIVAVLGAILNGDATATQAAGLGAIGALLIAGGRSRVATSGWAKTGALIGLGALVLLALLSSAFDLRVGRAAGEAAFADRAAIALAVGAAIALLAGILSALWSLSRSSLLRPVLSSTTEVTTMVFTILIGAALFSLVFRGLGGDQTIEAALASIPGGATGALIAVMVVMFVLGFFLDFIEITLVVVPLVAPALFILGVDPIWVGVLMAVNLQTSFLTPPFGFALFYLRGVAPPEVATTQIYKGALPFVAIQIGMLALLAVLPELATWLPNRLYAGG